MPHEENIIVFGPTIYSCHAYARANFSEEDKHKIAWITFSMDPMRAWAGRRGEVFFASGPDVAPSNYFEHREQIEYGIRAGRLRSADFGG